MSTKPSQIREPLQDTRRHKLLPPEVGAQLPALYATEGEGKSAAVPLKLFNCMSSWTLYVTEFDGDDTLYGYCVSHLGPDCNEWGYSSLSELANLNRAGLPLIERDCHWTPITVADAIA